MTLSKATKKYVCRTIILFEISSESVVRNKVKNQELAYILVSKPIFTT